MYAFSSIFVIGYKTSSFDLSVLIFDYDFFLLGQDIAAVVVQEVEVLAQTNEVEEGGIEAYRRTIAAREGTIHRQTIQVKSERLRKRRDDTVTQAKKV